MILLLLFNMLNMDSRPIAARNGCTIYPLNRRRKRKKEKPTLYKPHGFLGLYSSIVTNFSNLLLCHNKVVKKNKENRKQCTSTAPRTSSFLMTLSFVGGKSKQLQKVFKQQGRNTYSMPFSTLRQQRLGCPAQKNHVVCLKFNYRMCWKEHVGGTARTRQNHFQATS